MSSIRLKLAQPLKVVEGDSLDLLIQQPSDNWAEYDRQVSFPVRAQVKWQTRSEDCHNYGMEFLALDSESRTRLEACIKYYNQSPSYSASPACSHLPARNPAMKSASGMGLANR